MISAYGQEIPLAFNADPQWLRCRVRILRENESESLFNERCRVLTVAWEGVDPEDSFERFLVHGAGGHLAFGKHYPRKRWIESLKSARNTHSYSQQDIVADPWIGVAPAMVADRSEYQTTFDAYQKIGHAAQALFEEMQQDDVLSKVRIGRKLTLSERDFLLGNLWRAQAVNAYPWLLPLLVTALSNPKDPFRSIVEAIDAGAELLPLLQKTLKVPSNVIRALRDLPCWLPPTHHEACHSDLRPDRIAQCLARLPLEKRPHKDHWPRFLQVLRWASSLWGTHGDAKLSPEEKTPSFLPALMARIWLALARRPRVLPDPYQLDWLADLRRSIRLTHPWGGKLLFGEIEGEDICLPSETWALLWCLTRHPDDLAAEGRRWARRELSPVREAISSSTLAACQLPVAMDSTITLASGHRLAPIPGVIELVRQSAQAENCLPHYLPEIFSKLVSILAIHDANGNLVGHAEIRRIFTGNYEPGARRATRNRVLDKRIDKFILPSLAEISRHLNECHFWATSEQDDFLCEQARHIIRQSKAPIHAEDAARIMAMAGRRFKLHSKNSDTHAAREIDRLLKDGDYGLARDRAARHGAIHRNLFSHSHRLDLSSVAQGQRFNSSLPDGDDYPDGLVLPFLLLLHSPFHDGESPAMVRQLLGSYSIDFSIKLRIFEDFHQFSQLQVDLFRRAWTDESAEFTQQVRKKDWDWDILRVSAAALLNTLLLAAWYGIDIDPNQEAALIRSILDKAASRGLTRMLLELPLNLWRDNPLAAYVFRHALPPTHPAWAIGEPVTSATLQGLCRPNVTMNNEAEIRNAA